jgi:hypothetical protein
LISCLFLTGTYREDLGKSSIYSEASLKGEAHRFSANFPPDPILRDPFKDSAAFSTFVGNVNLRVLAKGRQLLAMALIITLENRPNGAVNSLSPECCNFFYSERTTIRNCSEACSAVATSTNVFSHFLGAMNLLCAIGD